MTDTSAAEGGRPPVVDVHVHTVPPRLVGRIEQGQFPGVEVARVDGQLRFTFPDMAPSPPAPAGLTDFAALAARRTSGIDLQLAGPWTDLLGYTLPEPVAASWSRSYNDDLAEECARHPGLVPMATIPLQSPAAAAGILEAAHSAGCRGAMIGTDIPDATIDSPELEPVWEAAATLGMPLLLHPTFIRIPSQLDPMGLKNAVGRIGVLTEALARLVYSGVLLRHPELVVVAALGGGAFVPARRRIARNHELGWSRSTVDLEASMQRLYFDTVVLDPSLLAFAIEKVGADRFLMGSDHPFPWEPDPVATVRAAGRDEAETSLMLGGTATSLYRLGPSAPTSGPPAHR